MSAARRSLLTASAAGSLLGALWFVPSANATQDEPVPSVSASTTASTAATTTAVRESTESNAESGEVQDHTQLADTGSINTTPYVFGGTLFLGLGAGFIFYSVRRERTMAY